MLEDEAVVDTIFGGPGFSLLFTLATWANHPRAAISWATIDGFEKAKITPARIRQNFVFEIGGSDPPARMLANLIRHKLGYDSTWQ